MRKTAVVLSVLSALLLPACASSTTQNTQVATRTCPLSQMTEIEASGDRPQNLAFQMAANAAIRNGYDTFSVIRSQQSDEDTYKMLIRMNREQDLTRTSMNDMYVAWDILGIQKPKS